MLKSTHRIASSARPLLQARPGGVGQALEELSAALTTKLLEAGTPLDHLGVPYLATMRRGAAILISFSA